MINLENENKDVVNSVSSFEQEKKEDMEKMMDSLMQKLENVPKWVSDALHQRAMKDAKKLFDKDELALEDIAFALYRSFNIGLALGMDSNDRFKQEDK
ncbi:hypothetical protein D3C81_1223800 [compost metagenome]